MAIYSIFVTNCFLIVVGSSLRIPVLLSYEGDGAHDNMQCTRLESSALVRLGRARRLGELV